MKVVLGYKVDFCYHLIIIIMHQLIRQGMKITIFSSIILEEFWVCRSVYRYVSCVQFEENH